MGKRKIDDILPSGDLTNCLPKKTCYLCGPMEYAKNNGLDWRLVYRDELAKLNIQCIIPEEEETGMTEEDMRILKEEDPTQYIKIMRQFIEMDLKFVEDCDMVVAFWDGERMSGTIGEAQHAYLHGTPIYLVSPRPFTEIPGWFAACFTETFESLGCLLLYLNKQSFYRV